MCALCSGNYHHRRHLQPICDRCHMQLQDTTAHRWRVSHGLIRLHATCKGRVWGWHEYLQRQRLIELIIRYLATRSNMKWKWALILGIFTRQRKLHYIYMMLPCYTTTYKCVAKSVNKHWAVLFNWVSNSPEYHNYQSTANHRNNQLFETCTVPAMESTACPNQTQRH